MTFTTPCFVRVKNPEERKELIEWLKQVGYLIDPHILRMLDADIVYSTSTTIHATYEDTMGESDGDGFVHCANNIPLFKALAAMRDDSDYMQWFITDKEEWFLSAYVDQYLYLCKRTIDNKSIGMRTVRKATKEEIIEYFE